MDVVPRTPWLVPLWARARLVRTSEEHHRRRPASPTQVIDLIYIADAAEEFLTAHQPVHTPACFLAGLPLGERHGAGRCTCGLSRLNQSLQNLCRDAK